jgi:hypothetical protein
VGQGFKLVALRRGRAQLLCPAVLLLLLWLCPPAQVLLLLRTPARLQGLLLQLSRRLWGLILQLHRLLLLQWKTRLTVLLL